MDDDLVRDGTVLRLTTIGRRSGAMVAVTVGFVERADGTLLIAAGDRESDWALNLLETPSCHVTLRGETFTAHATELDGPDRAAAIRELILRYGTPSERLGAGPAFAVQRVVADPSDARRRSR